MPLKICITCKEEKLLSHYRKDSSRISGYRSECKICSRARASRLYSDNYRESAQVRIKTRLKQTKELIDSRKIQCCLCPETEKVCLEFHHLDPTVKERNVSTMRNYSDALIIKELEKCVVVCSNCHKKVHAGLIKVPA